MAKARITGEENELFLFSTSQSPFAKKNRVP